MEKPWDWPCPEWPLPGGGSPDASVGGTAHSLSSSILICCARRAKGRSLTRAEKRQGAPSEEYTTSLFMLIFPGKPWLDSLTKAGKESYFAFRLCPSPAFRPALWMVKLRLLIPQLLTYTREEADQPVLLPGARGWSAPSSQIEGGKLNTSTSGGAVKELEIVF